MRAVQLTAFGNPVDGLECVDIPEPDTPGPNQVLIGVEYSPINPNDLMVAQGIYAFRPPLPAVIGNEGVGKVLAVGPGVENVRLGDRVLAPPSSFTWRERMVISAGGLSALPADSDPQQLAMLAINPPTAALLLSEYVDLQPGEWVVQNAANSGVGRWVIAFAKTRGLKTVNIVRRPGTRGRARGDRRRRRCRRLSGCPEQGQSGCRSGGAPPGARWRQWPGDGRAGSDALAPWRPRQLCSHERGSDVHQPARRYLQASHVARLLAGPSGNCQQNWPSNRAGGGDDRLRPGVHTSSRDLPHLLDQTGCRACATGRKNPSGRCRIIYLTSESSIRYGHHDQDQRRRSNGRCRLSCPCVRDKDRPLGGFGEADSLNALHKKWVTRTFGTWARFSSAQDWACQSATKNGQI